MSEEPVQVNRNSIREVKESKILREAKETRMHIAVFSEASPHQSNWFTVPIELYIHALCRIPCSHSESLSISPCPSLL